MSAGIYRTSYYNPHFAVKIFNHATGEPYGVDINDAIMSLDTTKNLGDPAGMWSLTLRPQIFGGGARTRGRTWAEIAQEMDYVEIAFGTRSGEEPTTVMRGFVDTARYVDTLDGSGNPQRRVLIAGRDFGKLWLNFKVFYLVELGQYLVGGPGLLNSFYDFAFGPFKPNEFLAEVDNRLIRRALGKLQARNRAIPSHRLVGQIPDSYTVNPLTTDFQAFQGPIYNLMAQVASKPYTECFFRDNPAETELVWRWAPLLAAGNRVPRPDHAGMPTVKKLTAHETTSRDMGISDNAVLNYLYAPPTMFGATGPQEMKATVPGYIDMQSIDDEGFRPYEPPFEIYSMNPSGDPAQEQGASAGVWGAQIAANVQWLADTMLINGHAFEGTMATHLRPDLLPGEYLALEEYNKLCYIEQVAHSFTVSDVPSVTTTLTLTRGQDLDAPAATTPGSYKYDDTQPGEIPGLSTHAVAPTREGAKAADQNGDNAADPNTVKNTAPDPTLPVTSSGGQGVADHAITLVGAPYDHTDAYLQDDLAVIFKRGIDCSELVAYCYRRGKGVKVTAYAQTQFDTMSRVATKDLQPGDALFFKNTYESADLITHSAIYIGDGRMVSADNEQVGVRIHNLSENYWQEHWGGAGRL